MDRRSFLKGLALVFLSPTELLALERNNIYLTIDDGPKRNMDLILKELRDNKVTFFVLGCLLHGEGYKKACKALELGHSIENHSYSHPWFSRISVDEAKREIEKTDSLIERIYKEVGILRKSKFFRFPYMDSGKNNKEEVRFFLGDLGYKIVYWDVDTEDWKYYVQLRTIKQILGSAASTNDGDIVLMHDLPITANLIIPFYVNFYKSISL